MDDATERAIIRTAIHQDRINSTPRDGNGAEQPATAIMWAERGDTLWTARRVRSPMIDDVGMGVYPGDIIVDRSGVRDGRPVGMGWFVISTPAGRRPPDDAEAEAAVLSAIGEHDMAEPERHAMITEPGRERLTVPGFNGRLSMGWSQALTSAMGRDLAGRTDPDMLRAARLQDALDQVARPCTWFRENTMYDVFVVEWHVDAASRIDGWDHVHMQYQDDDRVTVIDTSDPSWSGLTWNGAAPTYTQHLASPVPMDETAMMDLGRRVRDAYMAGRDPRLRTEVQTAGIITTGAARPLLELPDGRTAPDIRTMIRADALSIAAGKLRPERGRGTPEANRTTDNATKGTDMEEQQQGVRTRGGMDELDHGAAAGAARELGGYMAEQGMTEELRQRFSAYIDAGMYDPDKAARAVSRAVNRAAVAYANDPDYGGRRGIRLVAQTPFDRQDRRMAAQLVMDDLGRAIAPELHRTAAQQGRFGEQAVARAVHNPAPGTPDRPAGTWTVDSTQGGPQILSDEQYRTLAGNMRAAARNGASTPTTTLSMDEWADRARGTERTETKGTGTKSFWDDMTGRAKAKLEGTTGQHGRDQHLVRGETDGRAHRAR